MATEEDMLRALLQVEAKLHEREPEAFADMLRLVHDGKVTKLSKPQRAWVVRRYEELDLGVEDAQNLYSAGKVPDGIPEPGARHFETMQRPAVPPHRMARYLAEQEAAKEKAMRDPKKVAR
jgi:hypothetical protein